MLTFANPWLLLLALPLPYYFWRSLGRTQGAVRVSDHRLFTGLPAVRARRVRWLGAGLRTLALALLVVALAGPRWPDARTRLVAEGIAIQLVVDVSGSMAEKDFEWDGSPLSRLEALKKVLHLLVAGGEGPDGQRFEGRPNDSIGLVVFSDHPETRCPLTLSQSALLHILDTEKPRSEATNIGDALAWAVERLRVASTRRKVIVLFTDGYHNAPDSLAYKPRQAAQLAAALNIPIYTVDAGRSSAGVGETPAHREAAARVLREVAAMTGGQAFEAGQSQGLLAACQAIDRLERERIPSFQYRRYHEGYAAFGLAGFGLLISILGLESTVWRRVP